MAGGIGSRFWPMSTPECPKQFIDVLGCGRTLLQLTADRFKRRWPFAACFEMDHMAAGLFIGKNIDDLTKREVGALIGGSEGCFHLVDIVADVAKAARDLKNAGR